jgi:hypothetical protein
MGRLSQTKYYLSDFPFKITIIRRHHPLEGQQLELLSTGKNSVVVRLCDGSSLKILRRWTDRDAGPWPELAGDSQLCLGGLRELLVLFQALRHRRRTVAGAAGEKIDPPHHRAEEVDAQTKVAEALRSGVSGDALGSVSRISETRGHTAICTIDGAHLGAADSGAAKEAGGGR